MMRAALALGLALLATPALAQQGIQSLRYNDDFRYLADPARRDDFWDPIKFIPLPGLEQGFLSLGGELREKYESYAPRGFGQNGTKDNGYFLHRLLLHGDLRLADDFRVFAQIGDHLVSAKRPPLAATDRNKLDLQQAFVETRLFADGPSLRVGRQEISLGSQRLVSVRESPNIRRSFDGLRLTQTIGDVKLDGFYTRPVELKEAVFDDRSNPKQAFWGLYATAPIPGLKGLGADLYYLDFENDLARFGGITAPEKRRSVGARLFGARDGWDADLEAVQQFGRFGARDIDAWTLASSVGFTFAETPWRPRLGVKADIASGDRGGKSLGTFNPLFPKLAYFSEASLISPGNIANLNPSLTLRPLAEITITLGYDLLRKASRSDAIYGNPYTALAQSSRGRSDEIGAESTVDVTYQIDRHLSLAVSFSHFEAGRAVRDAGGRSVDYVMTQAAYRF